MRRPRSPTKCYQQSPSDSRIDHMHLPFAKTNGSASATSAFHADVIKFASTANTVADNCVAITQGSEAQTNAVERALVTASRITESLKQSVTQAESVTAAGEELASSVNELAASIEQVTAGS